MKLPDAWVNKIVVELQGAYGQQFIGKYSKVENGFDIGIANFKESLATRLGGFVSNPEALRYALDSLPTTHCPNVPELLEIAQRAPKKSEPALTYTPSPEDEAKAKAAIKKAAEELKPKISDVIDKHWATHPRTSNHLAFIFNAAARDARFKPCIEQMVADGICTQEGGLRKRYKDGEFVKA